MSPAGLYRYYDSLDGLITALITDAYNDMADHILAVTEAPGSPHDRFRDGMIAYRQWAVEHPNRFLLIFGTPINCGTVTAVMKTFLERTSWTLARPGHVPLEGCPTPRATKKKRAIILLSTGLVPPESRDQCDDATSLITSNCQFAFNAEVVGSLYAGAVESLGVGPYLDEAFKLGQELVCP